MNHITSLLSAKPKAVFAALAIVAAAGAATLVARAPAPGALELAQSCPAGLMAYDPIEVARDFHPELSDGQAADLHRRLGSSVCLPAHLPESFAEYADAQSARAAAAAAPYANVPSGVYRAGAEQKAALQASQASVPNAAGHWQSYGLGVQVTDATYPDGSNDGIPQASGRADNFAYDPVARRLFVAIGNGGIWVSDAVVRDVATLGDRWRVISNALPTQIVSAVAWTPEGGGTVIALTGENTQGGNSYVGLGAYWSNDLGQSWHHASGVPDGAFSFRLTVDPGHPNIVYAATGLGLFRSADAGRSFVNVRLPVSADCAGVTTGACQFANFVTDVVVQAPGGFAKTTCDAKGCPVLAGVGFRAGNAKYPDGKPQSPRNGLYRSATGEASSFAYLDVAAPDSNLPNGFTTVDRVGRIALGNAVGDAQDHGFVYAIVEDAVLFNGGLPILDLPPGAEDTKAPSASPARPLNATSINGVYVSRDFGTSWTRIADEKSLTYNPATGSTLAFVVALGVGPGVQSWYDLWIKPDPTLADPVLGAPLRLGFGMEEIWKNRVNAPVAGEQQTADDFKVIGTYFAGKTCFFLIGNLGEGESAPVCPTYDGVINGTTTHPDQHDGIYIPDDRGGVWLIVGNDGGVNKQYSAGLQDDFANNKWGNGSNAGFGTLMHYGIAAAKDGTVWYGNQDNATGKIEPDTRRQVRVWVGDGVYTAVDPDNSKTAYYQTPTLAVDRTLDGGVTTASIRPGAAAGTAHFLSPFIMDPLDAKHLVAAGTIVAETLDAPGTAAWTSVFPLGTDSASNVVHTTRSRALAVRGDAVYAGWCGPCNLAGTNLQFQRGIATNVGGAKPAKKGTADGWHQAAARGLPNRYIYNIDIDAADPKTVYVVLGGYSTARWAGPGQYLDTNANIGSGHVFKSTDGGENFVDISGNLPDIITTAVLKRGEQVIVGTDLGAFISSDLDGTSWAPLGDLPSVPVNQLSLSPSDGNLLFAATFGRGTQAFRFVSNGGGGGNTPPSVSAFTATPASGAAPLAVHFDAQASDGDVGDTLSYTFVFGDGARLGPQSASSADHTYTQVGSYSASVIVSDAGGATASSSLVIRTTSSGTPPPAPAPGASLSVTPASGEAPLSVAFDASGSNDPGGSAITEYRFDFGDGTAPLTQASARTSHRYDAAGNYNASVTVTNAGGQTSTPATVLIQVVTTVTVTPPQVPVAELRLSPTSGPAPLVVTFDGSGSFAPSGRSIRRYTFDFGDGSGVVSQAGPSVQHTYRTAGSYRPTLTVTDSSGQVSPRPAQANVGVQPQSTGGGDGGSAASGSGGALGLSVLLPLFGFGLFRRRSR